MDSPNHLTNLGIGRGRDCARIEHGNVAVVEPADLSQSSFSV